VPQVPTHALPAGSSGAVLPGGPKKVGRVAESVTFILVRDKNRRRGFIDLLDQRLMPAAIRASNLS
jgi:hypothetical protein